MRIKNLFQTVGVTLLGAVILLLAAALLFFGVWAFLPDRTGETHSYAAPSVSSEPEQPELYPWNLMTLPWEDGADTFDEDVLSELLEPFLSLVPQMFPPTLHVSPYPVNWGKGEFLCDESQTLFGVRDMEVRIRTYSPVIMEHYEGEDMVAAEESILTYRFSVALRNKHDFVEVCFVSLEPPPREVDLPDAEKAGLIALTEWVEKRDLNLESESPFAVFLWHFVDFCAQLEADYDAYNAAMMLYETGVCEITQAGHTVYCTFRGREGEMTLLCDPVYQTVYGISIRTYD